MLKVLSTNLVKNPLNQYNIVLCNSPFIHPLYTINLLSEIVRKVLFYFMNTCTYLRLLQFAGTCPL